MKIFLDLRLVGCRPSKWGVRGLGHENARILKSGQAITIRV